MSNSKHRPIIVAIHSKLLIKKHAIIIRGLCLIKIIGNRRLDRKTLSLRAVINNKSYPVVLKWRHGISTVKGYHLNHLSITIPLGDVLNADIQNKITIKNIANGDVKSGRILFSLTDGLHGHFRHSRLCLHQNMAIYLRQSIANTMYLTVRPSNYLDLRRGSLLIFLAKVASLVTPPKDIILLFEKECRQYQESAAVLYEKLRHDGYSQAYYVIDKTAPDFSSIPTDILDNVINKHSFKHLYYFFKCRKFIGTETIGHSIQLRCANRLIVKKEKRSNLQYVFLQHGVMYMISLNSNLRGGFRAENNPYKIYRIVVSSKNEAEHFTRLGGCNDNNLYITGLPKFDKAYANPDADKIIIMPTWRRWEANQAAANYEHTGYYQFVNRIVSAVPISLTNKVIILPHPLMADALRANGQYAKYLPPSNLSYDQILRHCRLLITDYSSIAYDAFYRGANVIFDWAEKDCCLEQYGKEAFLLLNQQNAFGDIVYDEGEKLTNLISKQYKNNQSALHLKRYCQIVAFHDNHNTERLISLLRKDDVI